MSTITKGKQIIDRIMAIIHKNNTTTTTTHSYSQTTNAHNGIPEFDIIVRH